MFQEKFFLSLAGRSEGAKVIVPIFAGHLRKGLLVFSEEIILPYLPRENGLAFYQKKFPPSKKKSHWFLLIFPFMGRPFAFLCEENQTFWFVMRTLYAFYQKPFIRLDLRPGSLSSPASFRNIYGLVRRPLALLEKNLIFFESTFRLLPTLSLLQNISQTISLPKI